MKEVVLRLKKLQTMIYGNGRHQVVVNKIMLIILYPGLFASTTMVTLVSMHDLTMRSIEAVIVFSTIKPMIALGFLVSTIWEFQSQILDIESLDLVVEAYLPSVQRTTHLSLSDLLLVAEQPFDNQSSIH